MVSLMEVAYTYISMLTMSTSSAICDSTVRPETLVRVCDECNFGYHGGSCVICGGLGKSPVFCTVVPCSDPDHSRPSTGISDAYYCAECVRLEKDRDGCPKIVNLGTSRTDMAYEKRRRGMLPCDHVLAQFTQLGQVL
jgi:hypothetical protein